MAREFLAASSQGLVGNTPISGYPFSLSCWANKRDTSTDFAVVVYDANVTNSRQSIFSSGAELKTRAQSKNNTGEEGNATTATGMTLDTWGHMGGSFASSTSRTAYSQGGIPVTDTTTVLFDSNIDTIEIGRESTVIPWEGYLGEIGV